MIAPWGACAPFVIARIHEFDLDQIQGCHARTTLNSGVDDVLDNWQIADRTREPKIKTDDAVRRDGRSFVPLFWKIWTEANNAQNRQGAINDLPRVYRGLDEPCFGSCCSRRTHCGSGPSRWWSSRKFHGHPLGRKYR